MDLESKKKKEGSERSKVIWSLFQLFKRSVKSEWTMVTQALEVIIHTEPLDIEQKTISRDEQ